MRSFLLLLLQFAYLSTFAQFGDACWISHGSSQDSLTRTCPLFRRNFDVKEKPAKALLYITAHGLYEVRINGVRVGNGYFTPGWTSYDKRLQYQEYDVQDLLRSGNNEILVLVGDGWYRGAYGGLMQKNNYGSDASVLLAMHISFKDSSQELIRSDEKWRSSPSAIKRAGIYEGETYDARFAPSKWSAVRKRNFSFDNLIKSECEPVRKTDSFRVNRIIKTPAGDTVADFGQNLAGWVKVKIRGAAGDTVRINHAEVLDKAGNFYTGNLRLAKAEDVYILKGNGLEIFEPHFTYHGFRYAKIQGCKPGKCELEAIALHTDMERTGEFSCSDTLINRLQKNIEWSMNSNFFDVPTDCPQRSERLGWTGDARVFCRTAAFNQNVQHFFTKWLHDLRADQGENGAVPNVIPDLYGHNDSDPKSGVAGWGDAATEIPWTMFEVYDDTVLLREQYPSMKKWVDYIRSEGGGFLWRANGFGDWLAPGDATYLPFIDQCFWIYSVKVLIRASEVLGYPKEVQEYSLLLEKIKDAFHQQYIEKDGRTLFDTQTSYVLALQFGVLPDSLRKQAVAHLVRLIESDHAHLSTGFLGTPYLLAVLSDNGRTDIAYKLLNQQTYPSWLYPVRAGATTIWERWDGILPDSNVQATSYNHYAYGAVGQWLYEVVAGIRMSAPGYKKIIIEPHCGGGLSWAKASYKCKYGKIVSEWKILGAEIQMDVEIPLGSSAIIRIPGKGQMEAGPGKYHLVGRM